MSDSLTRALRQLETPICPLQDTDARRRQDAQAAYVATWRAEHPNEVYGETWGCPLCGKILQSNPSSPGTLPATQLAERHQWYHGKDWNHYLVAAVADRTPARGSQAHDADLAHGETADTGHAQ